MVTTIKEKNGVLYCAHCRMRIKDLRYQCCQFCGYEFTNWEQFILELKEREKYDSLYRDDR